MRLSSYLDELLLLLGQLQKICGPLHVSPHRFPQQSALAAANWGIISLV